MREDAKPFGTFPRVPSTTGIKETGDQTKSYLEILLRPDTWHLPLDRSRSLEQPDQIDDQNDHHHQLQHKRSVLVELIDHEAIKLLGGVDFLVDQIFVIGRCV